MGESRSYESIDPNVNNTYRARRSGDRAKGKQYGSGLWLILANVQFRVILYLAYFTIHYLNRRAKIEMEIRN